MIIEHLFGNIGIGEVVANADSSEAEPAKRVPEPLEIRKEFWSTSKAGKKSAAENYPKDCPSLAEFFGIVLGDGSITNHQVTISVNTLTDYDYAKWIFTRNQIYLTRKADVRKYIELIDFGNTKHLKRIENYKKAYKNNYLEESHSLA